MSKFRQYHTFVAVAETGSLSGAGKALHLTPSAVSKQISVLENELNTQLLERSNKKVSLTTQGANFYSKCVAILKSVKDAEEEIKTDQSAIAGKIRVAFPESLSRSSVFDVFTEFSDKHPDVYFDISLSDRVEELLNSNFDFAFRLGSAPDSPRFESTKLIKTKVVCCASARYIDSYGMINSYEDAGQHKFIIPQYENISDKMRSYFKEKQITLARETCHIIDKHEARVEAVKSGLGIGMFVDIGIEKLIKNSELKIVLPDSGILTKCLYLVGKKNIQEHEKIKRFRQFVVDYV